MRTVWVIAGALAAVLATTTANADTVYLKNGEDIWGQEVDEEGDTVIIVRPGGDIRVPKGEVNRIERVRTSLPPFYSPPAPPSASATGEAATPTAPGSPAAPGSAVSPAPPAAAGGPPPPPPPLPGATAAPVPSPGAGPTELPPPPPPPMPGTLPSR